LESIRRREFRLDRFLDNEQCIFRKPAAVARGSKRLFCKSFAIRRIAEQERKRLERAARSELGSVAPINFRDPGKLQRLDIGADQRARFGGFFDKEREQGPARKRFDSKRAGAGE
jgi:hypothetical protein